MGNPRPAGLAVTAAFNLGNTGGPWAGGVVIDAGFGFASTAWAGGAITAAAIGTTAVSLRLHRRTRASRRVAGSGAGTSSGAGNGASDSTRDGTRGSTRDGTVNPVRTDV